MSEDWEFRPLNDVIDFNPKESLKAGTVSPYIDMASLPVASRWHSAPITRAASSGSRFKDGDTLLARLTPCLENGKTAEVRGLGQGVVGWGSTEFIVMRAKAGIILPGLVYLLAREPAFRDYAVQQMTGTSGRQRVPVDTLRNYEMALPPLSEQQRIVDVMSVIDDLAECQLKILEQIDRIVPTIARLSIDMSSVTTERKLTDLVTITNGYSYTSAELVDESATALVNLKNFARTGGFRLDGLKPLDGSPKPSQVLVTGDILLAKTDLTQDAEVVGRCMRMPKVHGFTTFVASLDAAILRPTLAVSKEALLALLSLPEFRDHCLGYANGTTVLHLSKDALPAYTVTLPDEEQMKYLSATIASLGAQQDHALSELHAATSLHDFLLPRLLSGELRVSEAEKQLEEVS